MNACRSILFCLLAALLFGASSCALLFNEKSQCIKIRVDSTLRLAKVDTAKLLYHEPGDVEYYVKRGREPLRLDFVTKKDSQHVSYYLKKHLSPAYALANLASPMCLGYIIDLARTRRFMYCPTNYFGYDTAKGRVKHSILKPVRTGNTRVKLGWNYVNTFDAGLFRHHMGSYTPVGFNLGLEHFLAPDRSVQAEIGYAVSNSAPVRMSYHFTSAFDSATRTKNTSFWMVANYKVHRNRMAYGAGICLAGLKYYVKRDYFVTHDSVYYKPLDTITITKYSHSRSFMTPLVKMGLNFRVDCKISELLALGFNWQCYLADLNTRSVYASHFFSAHLEMKIYEFYLKRKKQTYATYRPEK